MTSAKLKLEPLKGDAAFQRLKKGRSGRAASLNIRWLPTPTQRVRAAIVVTRKVGKAVTRNRVRRRLREGLRALLREAALSPAARCGELPSFDLIIFVRPDAAAADYHTLKAALAAALRQAKVIA